MKQFLFIVLTILLLSSCKEDPVTTSRPPDTPPDDENKEYVYVLNEGNFSDPFGARLTVHNLTDDTTYYNVFEGANSGYHLGSVGDDMKLFNGILYVLMSNSQALLTIRTRDNKLTQQLYFNVVPHDLVIDTLRGKAYITQLFNNSVYVMNLGTFAIIDSISVGANPQGMLISGDKLYVCNSGYGADSTVTIVNVEADTILATVRVGYGPGGVARLADGNIIVSCTGNAFGTPPSNGNLAFIDQFADTLIDALGFSENLFGHITVDSAGMVYLLGVTSGSFYGGPVHKVDPVTKTVTQNFIAGTFYSLTLDEHTQDLYVTNVKDFAADGDVIAYKNDGTFKFQFKAQLGPATVVFKR